MLSHGREMAAPRGNGKTFADPSGVAVLYTSANAGTAVNYREPRRSAPSRYWHAVCVI
jgi:hypothetical protein